MAAGRRAADLVQHMLSFARRTPLEKAPLDLHTSLREVRRLLSHTLDKRIELDFDLGARCATILGDGSQIQNALLNVALNARDAMPEGGRLDFVTHNRDLDRAAVAKLGGGVEPGTFIEVLCRDTGVGMPPEVLERAFEPFYTTKEPGKGTGLGLAAVYGCVQAHGGFVEIESAAAAGTSVRILLPVLETHPASRESDRRLPLANTGTARVLVADDEELVARLMVKALKQAGYLVDACSDGAAAVELYSEDPARYDVVVLDVMMPKLDGRQAFDSMRRLTPGLRCVFVSGYSDQARIGGLLAEGRCGFVQKPFALERLLEAVRVEVDGARRVPASGALGR
jgi:CheY-like chemotaxis protein